MSDNPKSTHLVRVSKHQARALEKAEFISYLSGADLSDARRYFELARYSTRQHDKAELMAGAVVGILVAALIGGGSWPVTVLTALGAFGATLVVIFLIHWLRAPSAFHKQAQADLKSARLLLEQEKERNKKAQLVGRIICLNTQTPLPWAETVEPPPWNPSFNRPSEYRIVTLHVSVTNDTEVAASAIGFELSLTLNSTVYSGHEMPVVRGYLKRTRSQPGGPPRRVEWEAVQTFPLNVEITHTTHQTGWLRFWVGPKEDFRLDDTSALKLTVFDHRNELHTIYDGPIKQIPNCGIIVEGHAEAPAPGWE